MIVFVLANSVDSDEMITYVAFHLYLHSSQIMHLGVASIWKG